jgi:hypothetical protein
MSRLPTPESEDFTADSGSQAAPTIPLTGALGQSEGLSDAELLEADNRSGPSGNNLLGQSTILIVMIALVATGTLYGMHLSQGSAITDSEQVVARIEQLIVQTSQWDWEGPGVAGQIVPPLETVRQQVPLAYVKKNPFSLQQARAVEQAPGVVQPTSSRKRQQQIKRWQGEVDRMKLQSVMSGTDNFAIIDGEFYRKNSLVGSFRIKYIDAGTQAVILVVDGAEFQLTME